MTTLLFVIGVGALLVLGVPSIFFMGFLMVMFGGCIVGEAAPTWWRFVVGFGAFMVAGAALQAIGYTGAGEGAYDALRR